MAIDAPTIVDSGPPPPPPAPTSELHVTPATVDSGPKAPPPEKGSARENFNKRLRAKAGPRFYEQKEESPPQSPPAVPAEKPEPTGQGAEVTPPPAPEPKSETPKPEDKKTKTNPWKLVDEYKARATKAEGELVEARKGGLNPQERKTFEEQITNLRKQNDELENEIRFTNYSKSTEFKAKFQEPYEKAWFRAVKELSQIPVTEPGGTKRKATVQDLSALVNMDLESARNLADDAFGKFADDVMGYRKEILALHEAQEAALKEAKDKGTIRDKERMEQYQRFKTETSAMITSTWQSSNESFLNSEEGAQFKPIEGDEEGNQRLAKGFELVDKAYAENATDPNLTPEQRAAIIRRHAAVRLRAAGYGRLKYQLSKEKAEHAKTKEKLAKFESTVPSTGGTIPQNGNAQPSSARAALSARLHKLAQH